MDTLILDQSLQANFPTVTVGVYTPFEPLRTMGARILLTQQGLLLEACNEVFHTVQPLASVPTNVKLPYGVVPCGTKVVDPASAQVLTELMQKFVPIARDAGELETMMLVVKGQGQPLRAIFPSFEETNGSLKYDYSQIQAGETVILDVHSHGHHGVYFSNTDDEDDLKYRGNLKVSYVLGQLHQPRFAYTQRWVSRGLIFDQSADAKYVSHFGSNSC